MKNMKPLEKIYFWIILIFMYLPIVTLIVLSFNQSKSRAHWGGFTFNWYIRLFSDSAILNALANTLIIALISTLAATIIGTVTCVALVGLNKRTRAVIMGITNIPMINADIVTGISLMLLFRVLNFQNGFLTVLIAHITFNIPYVMLSVMPRMKTISPSVYEAALDLGAKPWYAFRRTVLPDLMPAIFSGALMAFTMSLDDFIITYFTKGSGFDTLSTKIYNEIKRGIQPEIYALSAIIFTLVLVLIFASNRMRSVQRKDRELTEKQIKFRNIRNTVVVSAAGLGIIYLALLFGGVFTKNSNQVYVYNYGEYIDPEVIRLFQEETGIEVVYDEYETNEIMFTKIASDPSSYDVVCPADYTVSRMISLDMVEPLDYDQLPNTKEHIGKRYFEAMEAFDPGNQYAVPYFWGTVGILYNTTMVDDEVNSWDILWNPKYKGEILMQDSVRDAFMIPMIRNGFSINTVDPAEVEIAAQDLIDQAPLVQAYVVDQVRDKMIGNEAALGVIYSGEALYCQWENEDLEYVVPDEGSLVWFDSWVITKNARNKENALKWIDFLSRPEIALMNFEFITYSVPNETAREMIEDEELRNSEIAFPGEDILDRCYSEEYLGEAGEKLYGEAWKRVKSAN
ncbi:MAG: extracellular solute-binding protein [Flexilinea sp.]|nr:extracellular solute-binding protein [Flexilinea sp.]